MDILMGWIIAGVDWAEPHQVQPGEFAQADDDFWYFVYAGAVLGWILYCGLRWVLPRPAVSTPAQRNAEFIAGRVVLLFAVAGAVLGCALPPWRWLSLIVDFGERSTDASVNTAAFPTVRWMVWMLGCAGWCAVIGQLVAWAFLWRQANRLPSANAVPMRQPHEDKPTATVPSDAVEVRPDDGRFIR